MKVRVRWRDGMVEEWREIRLEGNGKWTSKRKKVENMEEKERRWSRGGGASGRELVSQVEKCKK